MYYADYRNNTAISALKNYLVTAIIVKERKSAYNDNEGIDMKKPLTLDKTKLDNWSHKKEEEERGNTMKTDTSMIFNVLVKKDVNFFVAHCLELDIVATAKDSDKVTKEILDLIKAQVGYAFANDNLAYLYRPAPPEAWEEFYACKKQIEQKIEMKSSSSKSPHRFIPPWITARTCLSLEQACCA